MTIRLLDKKKQESKSYDLGELTDLIFSMREVNLNMNPVFEELQDQPDEDIRSLKTSKLRELRSATNKLKLVLDNLVE